MGKVNGLMRVAAKAPDFEIAVPGVERIAERGRWLGRTLEADLGSSRLSLQAQPSSGVASHKNFGERSADDVVAGRAVIRSNGG
jgi:hypothetical protein